MSCIDDHHFVFVGGLHRSGTTVFADALKAHPEVSGFRGTDAPRDEGQHLQSVYPPAEAHGGPGSFALDPEAHLTEQDAAAGEGLTGALFDEWREHWDLGKPVLLEKSPPNLIRGRFLQACFPRSTMIVLVRHPVAVSLATRKWSSASLWSLLRHWVRAHRLLEADSDDLDRLIVVPYASFVRTPHETVDAVVTSLGLTPIGCRVDVRSGEGREYFEAWRARRGSGIGWDGFYSAALAWWYGPRVGRFGYDLDDPGVENCGWFRGLSEIDVCRPPGEPG